MRVHPKSTVSPAESFKFRVEERLQCLASAQVRYTHRYNQCCVVLVVDVLLITHVNLDLNIIYQYQFHLRLHLIWKKFASIMNRKKRLLLAANHCRFSHSTNCRRQFFVNFYLYSRSAGSQMM